MRRIKLFVHFVCFSFFINPLLAGNWEPLGSDYQCRMVSKGIDGVYTHLQVRKNGEGGNIEVDVSDTKSMSNICYGKDTSFLVYRDERLQSICLYKIPSKQDTDDLMEKLKKANPDYILNELWWFQGELQKSMDCFSLLWLNQKLCIKFNERVDYMKETVLFFDPFKNRVETDSKKQLSRVFISDHCFVPVVLSKELSQFQEK